MERGGQPRKKWGPRRVGPERLQFGWSVAATDGHNLTRRPPERKKKRAKIRSGRGKKNKIAHPRPLPPRLPNHFWPPSPLRAPTFGPPAPSGFPELTFFRGMEVWDPLTFASSSGLKSDFLWRGAGGAFQSRSPRFFSSGCLRLKTPLPSRRTLSTKGF